MDNLGFLGVAYAFAWIAISVYLISLFRRQRSIEKRLEELTQKRQTEDRGA